MVVFAVFETDGETISNNGAMGGQPVGNARKDLGQVERCIDLVINA